MPSDAAAYVKGYEQCRSHRANWDSLWQQVGEVVWPDTAEFTAKREPGTKRTQRVFDSTATIGAERFAAWQLALNTPPTQQWQILRPIEDELQDDHETGLWLDQLTSMLFEFRAAPKAGFYTAIHEVYKSLGVYGTGVLFVDWTGTQIIYRAVPLHQIYAQTNDQNIVDTVYRCYQMTGHQVSQRFKNVPQRMASMIDRDPWLMHEFLHVVKPRADYDPDRSADSQGKRFVSAHIALEDKALLEEDGYHENPYLVARYTVNAGEVYGRSPAIMVLPDILTLQEMMKTFLKAGRRAVEPPLLLANDNIMGSGGNTIDLRAGGINYGGVSENGALLVHPLATNTRLDINEVMMERLRQSINDAFGTSLLQILAEKPDMTATEVLVRAQEKGQQTTPGVGRIREDLLDPMTEREVNLVDRAGLMPPAPDIFMRSGEYKMFYQSEATRLQRSDTLLGIQRVIQTLAPFAATNPALLDQIFKPFEVGKLAADIESLPRKIIRSDQEREQLVQAMEQQAMEQQMIEQGPRGLKDVATAAKIMGETAPRAA